MNYILQKHDRIKTKHTEYGSLSFILSDMRHIMIHMKRYSICINDTFCLVLDQIKLDISTNFTVIWEF